MTAQDIERLLQERHHKDVFVPQCKTGASYGTGLAILDAWAMAKSWAHPCVWGYEIKVARSDFLHDTKWTAYLEYCNAFSFVCPWGLIQVEELPRNVGLLWVNKVGTGLVTKRRAPQRTDPICDDVFRYILMTRCKITRETWAKDNREYWQQWLDDRKADNVLGHTVSKTMRRRFEQQVEAVERENDRLTKEIENLQDIRQMCQEMGVNPKEWRPQYRIKEALEAVPHDLVDKLRRAADALDGLRNRATIGVMSR